ncbi:MAG: DUF3488 domain-containing protein [Deltaproteobacteria bacterium]|nr:DUF3488 domain-containing protein [Deltaproteobacteria bacterium]
MSFERLHKLVVYATVVVGLLPLASSGELPMAWVVATYAAVVLSWVRDVPLERVAATERFWTVVTVVALVVLGILAFVTTNYLLYAILFVMVLVVTRLFQSRSSRDVFQLYGLTFMAVTAGAIINPAVAFIGIFFAYLVLLVWGLILLHIQRDIEALQDEQASVGERPRALAWQASDLVSRRFLLGSSVLATLIFIVSMVIFFFFPRLGAGMFFDQGRARSSVSGFSDKIELGHFGTIKDNMQVVMRVELPDARDRSDLHLRLRGISFDRYDTRTNVWSKTAARPDRMRTVDEGVWVTDVFDRARRAARPDEILRQEIYLEPLDTPRRMVFGAPTILSIGIDNPMVQRFKRTPLRFYEDEGGDISASTPTDVALRYSVESWQPRGLDQRVEEDDAPIPAEVRGRYLEIPDGLDPRIGALARELSAAADTPYDRARAIERRLSNDWSYTTQGGTDRVHPLEDFLFVRKAGHCEYFASAMVLMLRTLGIPARPANGFYGGAWNPYGRFYTIRQADAHAWVEAWFAGIGWLTMDPTPASEVLVPNDTGLLASIQEAYDSFKLQWFKWVVEYDFEKQLAMFRSLGQSLSALRDLLPKPKDGSVTNPQAWKRGLKEWFSEPANLLLLASPFVLFLLFRLGVLGWLWRRVAALLRRRAAAPGGEVGERYRRMLSLLTGQGIGRGPGETPRELAERLSRQGYPASEAVARLTAAFEEVRYAERELPPEAVRALDEELSRIRKARTG